MNIHAAPLPKYRGNWTTRMALYNDDPPEVTAHVVTPWIDEGPIVGKLRYKICKGDTLEEIDRKAMHACIK
ncbi:formyltransferase family protein, partial [Acinetobacter baumannii]|uniref:formyltransferase family protein n=1 Tax=Acinetobacter baumannii TaxID=470 RepID=UPI0034D5AF5D